MVINFLLILLINIYKNNDKIIILMVNFNLIHLLIQNYFHYNQLFKNNEVSYEY